MYAADFIEPEVYIGKHCLLLSFIEPEVAGWKRLDKILTESREMGKGDSARAL